MKRRRATLPHPLECSTIAAPGLSYRVRNGTGRLTRAMTTANLTATARKPKESKPACHRWRFGNRLADARQSLPLYRLMTIPTHIAVQDDPAQERRGTNHHVVGMLCRRRPLVPVGSTPHGASTSYQTRVQHAGYNGSRPYGILILEQASRLDAFSGYPSRT